MINTSNEYRKYIVDSIDSTLSRNFRAKADIILADDTVLTITEEDIVVGGLKINDATSASNNFQIGSAIINQCTLMLNNIGGKFDQYDFTDAVIRPYIGLKLSETTEWLKKGVFTVDEPTVASSIISLVALDNMNKFDTPFSDVAISFPCTQLQLLQAVCLHCGVSLTNATFTNSDFVVTRRPNDEAITCREIVAWIAQNSGNFARCNTDGVLELKWYDTEAFEQADSLDGGAFDGQTTDKCNEEKTYPLQSLDDWSRYYKNSPAIVTNPNDTTYQKWGFSDAPLENMEQVRGGMFGSVLPINGNLQGGIDTPATAWAGINISRMYLETNDATLLPKIRAIGDFFLNHVIDIDIWGIPLKAMPDAVTFDEVSRQWIPSTRFIHTRTFYHVAWALLEIYDATKDTKYSNLAGQLLDGATMPQLIATGQANSNELPPYFSGAMFNTINNVGEASYDPDWVTFSNTNGDVVVRATNKWIELFGNSTRVTFDLYAWEDRNYTVKSIADNYIGHLLYLYNNQGLRRPDGHNLLYNFSHYEWEDEPHPDGYMIPVQMNWDFIDDVFGKDQWFTGDLMFWAIIGFAEAGETQIATSLLDRYYELKAPDSEGRLLFYDRYTAQGTPLVNDTSKSIAFTGLYMQARNILGNHDYDTESLSSLEYYQKESAFNTVDGGFSWDVEEYNSFIENKSLGEILFSIMENVAKIKPIEKGSQATPWTPAPEDVSPYQSGDNADGGDFTYTEQTHYDGGTFKQAEKYHHIYALNQATIGTDDVIITGIQVKAQGTKSDYGETVLFGNKGYVIEITNPLITENTASIIANSVGAKIVGMRFRPCDISALSDPSREAGDVAYLSHKGSTYQILLTNVSYQIGGNNSISCDAETPSRKQSVRFDASTKAIVEARNIAKQEISSYDLEQQRFNNLVFHSFGLYRTEEVLEDGSTIEYAHDKPTLAESANIWRQSGNAFVVSNDGGVNWRGMDADGNILANVLNAIGVNAEWINVLTNFKVGNNFNVDANGNLTATNADIKGKITATSGSFTGSINSSSANITGGTFNVNTSSVKGSAIRLTYGTTRMYLSPYEIDFSNATFRNYVGLGGVDLTNKSTGQRAVLYYNDLASPPNYGLTVGNLQVDNFAGFKDINVTGTKNRVVDTENYGRVLLNAYETPRPTFADTGHAQIGEDGLCYVDIDLIFLETIDQTHDYRHFLTKYGQGDIWIKESNTDYFIVEGTPNLKFDWKIEAVQRDYNTYNLEQFVGEGQGIEEIDYISLADEYLQENEKEMIPYE